jgi:hypothetical protein
MSNPKTQKRHKPGPAERARIKAEKEKTADKDFASTQDMVNRIRKEAVDRALAEDKHERARQYCATVILKAYQETEKATLNQRDQAILMGFPDNALPSHIEVQHMAAMMLKEIASETAGRELKRI